MKLFTQNIEGWDFASRSDGTITAANDTKIGIGNCFHFYKSGQEIDPNNIEKDIEESRVKFDKITPSDIIPGKFPDETEAEEKMEPFVHEVIEHLIEFCRRFVEKANG